MEKYLGNKKSLLPLIEAFFRARIPRAKRLSDVFAGTSNVSRYFRSRGWTTAACDANRFSYVLAQAYLGTKDPPKFEAVRTRKIDGPTLRQMRFEFGRAFVRFGNLYLPNHHAEDAFHDLAGLANVLVRLQGIGDGNERPGVITDCYTRWGSRARFLSVRGTRGTRNYFSRRNALFLDGALATVRRWWRAGRLQRNEIWLLLTSIIEEVVITANVNGTFHDFNRDRIWPNAEQSFRLRLPLVSCSDIPAEVANADALYAAATFREHDICYLDPPYNFRQYTAYYHLLNFIAAYPFLENVETYVSGLTHVRGQHPEDDFSSDFCYRERFIGSLKRLVQSVDAKHVVLSYYGGRNHWNHWSKVSVPNDGGLHLIRELFQDRSVFSDCEVVPALDIRKNYQSRVGEQKELVNEYLFHGVLRRRTPHVRGSPLCALAANVRWGLTDEFGHNIPAPEDHVDEAIRAVGS